MRSNMVALATALFFDKSWFLLALFGFSHISLVVMEKTPNFGFWLICSCNFGCVVPSQFVALNPSLSLIESSILAHKSFIYFRGVLQGVLRPESVFTEIQRGKTI